MLRGVKASHLPPRLAAGAYILNSGLSKRDADDQTAVYLYNMTKETYPFFGMMKPHDFMRLLSAGEIALGSALLLPVVPSALAGAGLVAFSAAILGVYLRTPGMHEKGSLRPTQQGTALAKDVWLLGMGLGLVIDDISDGRSTSEAAPEVAPEAAPATVSETAAETSSRD